MISEICSVLFNLCYCLFYLLIYLHISVCVPKSSRTPNILHKMKTGFLFLVTYMYFLAPVHQATPRSATIPNLSFRNMDFAMNLYRKISSFHDKNIFFSPLSISTSFTTLLMASDGVTREEILKGLNLHRLERAGQPEFLPELFQLLNENITQNGSLALDQSMALFLNTDFEINKTFEKQIKKYFDADIKSVDFGDIKKSVDSINSYIKEKTHGKVTEVIPTLDPMTHLMLINTIFFQGELTVYHFGLFVSNCALLTFFFAVDK